MSDTDLKSEGIAPDALDVSIFIEQLAEFEAFYVQRPSVSDRTPLCAEISKRECLAASEKFGEAAALIERQQKEIEAMKAGFAKILSLSDLEMQDGDAARGIARALLRGGSK